MVDNAFHVLTIWILRPQANGWQDGVQVCTNCTCIVSSSMHLLLYPQAEIQSSHLVMRIRGAIQQQTDCSLRTLDIDVQLSSSSIDLRCKTKDKIDGGLYLLLSMVLLLGLLS